MNQQPTADLGWAVARLDKELAYAASLYIIKPSGVLESGAYTPPESIRIYGSQAIIALRDFLVENYPIEHPTGNESSNVENKELAY